MMMARDSTPNRPALSQATLDSLKVALQEYLLERRDTPTVSLQSVLRRIAAEAREKRIHAEQLLVSLKDVWFSLPDIGRPHDAELQNRLLQRVVTLCIREYYST
jgi:hypothetical protein